jgi:uroporphyrin-III C-methyltransferase
MRAVVSFVGAGPGDPELITVKGLRRLREARVIIHDRLVPRPLLAEAGAGAELLDVGKRPGCHGPTQGEINRLIVDRARRAGRVVRLKGADPTVFGRLNEEIRAARAAGLDVEVIAGVTAATAAAAAAGVSLTERGTSSVVVLAAGTDQHGGDLAALDWRLLAEVRGTLALYMPVRRLASIMAALAAFGRDPDEPALVVEATGTSAERVVSAPLGEIAGAAEDAGIGSPAVLITGPALTLAAAGPAAPHTLDVHASWP